MNDESGDTGRSGPASVRYACRSPSRLYPYAIAYPEFLVRRLGDGEHPSRIELDSDFHDFLASGCLFRGCTAQSAQYRANRRTDHVFFAAAYRAAGHTADDGARACTDRRLGPFDIHLTHRLHNALLHLLGGPGLVAAVVLAADAAGAAAK